MHLYNQPELDWGGELVLGRGTCQCNVFIIAFQVILTEKVWREAQRGIRETKESRGKLE